MKPPPLFHGKEVKVCCIVVTYNGIKWVDQCFESLRHSKIPLCTIVIDNGSADGTVQKIKSDFPEVTLIESKENLGFGKANNVGIIRAFGEGADFIFLLNQDAWIKPDTIGALIAVAEEQPSAGILSPVHYQKDWKNFDIQFNRYVRPSACPGFLADFSSGKMKAYYTCEFINAAAWLLTRECISRVGLFEPLFYLYGEDANYVQRTNFHGLNLVLVPQSSAVHDRAERKGEKNEIGKRIEISTFLFTRLLNPNRSFPKNMYQSLKVFVRFGFNGRTISQLLNTYKNIGRVAGVFRNNKTTGYLLKPEADTSRTQ